MPSDWRDGVITFLYKGKGLRSGCSSYRPVTLLSVPEKVFSHVLLNRLKHPLTRQRRPQQSGFTGCRSTMDTILALRMIAKIHREIGTPLHVAYIDIKAAFDSVNREALWMALKSQGTPPFLLRLIKRRRL